MSNDNLRLVTIILDRSGSMQAVKDDAEGGLKAFLAAQREAPGLTLVTLRQFDDEVETVFQRTPLYDVPDFTLRPRGTTALLDAIGSTVAATEEHLAKHMAAQERPGEVVYVIVTDGHENASREWTAQQVKDTITRQRGRGRVFVFLGADQDAITVAGGIGIGAETSLSYSSANTRDSLTSAGHTVARGSRSGDYSFTREERTRAAGS
ncbi:vWA domain-containing protein [Actinomadura sp. NBRC 104412]|uniref:vWA domain-containing protein n=1 Tax=Actinomadura sp. NBRC 104412 TaxID=3032203 RepID=UPI002555570D|nr:vWA domain-containing protein [Actinomadura sp. NBRC 104412]